MRIGIVNDLLLAREGLRRIVASSPAHQVVWTANDGAEAVEKARQDRPDLILMDLIMPVVDGVEATRRIMRSSPCAILVVTASVSGNMNKVYEAMGHGALDAIDTPMLGGRGDGSTTLLGKIDTIGKLVNKGSTTVAPTTTALRPLTCQDHRQPVIVLGSSTGGPSALAEILSAYPKTGWNTTTVIVQHIDVDFAPGLASWLADRTNQPVTLIEPGMTLEPGKVLLAGTNDHLTLRPDCSLDYTPEPLTMNFRPSVDVFFKAMSCYWITPGVAALLTGMGRDGALGLRELRQQGWHTIAQDEATCISPFMPRAAVELDAAAQVLPLSKIGEVIVSKIRQFSQSVR